MNRKEIEKMISLADDSYVEEIFTTKLYERKHHVSAWIAAAAAVAIAAGAAGIAMNSADSDKIVTELQDMLTETETDTSALESVVTGETFLYSVNNRDYFKNKPDDAAEFYYTLLERSMDFTTDGPVYRFSTEYLNDILLFDGMDFSQIEGGLQCDENGVPLYAGIRLYNSDTDNLPMVHMVFYKDGSHFAGFDKSPYSPVLYGDTELYGFDFSESKDGSELMACWRYEDTNYMFTSRGLGFDRFIEIISPYIQFLRDGDFGLKYVDHFTLDSFDLNSVGGIKAVSDFRGSSEMNRSSVFAGYIPDYTPFVGLHYTESSDNYNEVSLNGEVIYRRYNELYNDPESYETGNGSEKVYISLIYEWGNNPDADTEDNSPVIPFEEITPEKLDEIRIDEDYRESYRFVIPVNDFTITVLAACEREQLLEAIDAIRSHGGNVEQLTLAEANAREPFAGYVPQSSQIDGLELTLALKETSDTTRIRIQYRGEEIKDYPADTEYVHFYYVSGGSAGYSSVRPTVSFEDITAEKLDEIKYFGDSKITRHSFYVTVSNFHIRVEALCSSEKLMKFFKDMPNYKGLKHSDGGNSDEINSTEIIQSVTVVTENTDSEDVNDGTVMYDGIEYRRSELSEETLEWLDWYNSLSEEEQDTVSYVPSELQRFLKYNF